MTQNLRKWGSLLCGIILYYIIHEGAHLIIAVAMGTFQRIDIVGYGLGVQVVADTGVMSKFQVLIFCIVGIIATLIVGYILVWKRSVLLKTKSKFVRALAYYTTLIFLMLDPLYLSVIHNFVGGGDMNGITQLGIPMIPESIFFFVIAVLNIFIIVKYVYKDYKESFANKETYEMLDDIEG